MQKFLKSLKQGLAASVLLAVAVTNVQTAYRPGLPKRYWVQGVHSLIRYSQNVCGL